MSHEVTVPRRDFETVIIRVLRSTGPVDVIRLFPLRSTRKEPVAFDVRTVDPFVYVTVKWLVLSARVYSRISYEVLSRSAMLPFTWKLRFTLADSSADRIHMRLTLSGNGPIVTFPSGSNTGVMLAVHSCTTSLAGSL